MTRPATPAGGRERTTVTVAVLLEKAFRLFTEAINLWWRRGTRFRNLHDDQGIICLEPRVGGRVFESTGAGLNEEKRAGKKSIAGA